MKARHLIGPVALVLSLHLIVLVARGASTVSPPEPAESTGVLMPAAGGPLDEIVIQFHRPGQEFFLPVYEQLFAAFDPTTEVVVVVGDEQDRVLFEAARRSWAASHRSGPSVRYTLVGRPITSWARDRLAVLSDPGGAGLTILAPPTPMVGAEARANDWLVPWTLSEHLGEGARLQRANFRFEGGDLIADAAHVYVASPLFGRNPEVTPARLVDSLRETLSLPVVRFGRPGHPAPSHHIGMFVTPLGEGVVAFGDPDLAAELTGRANELAVGDAPFRIDSAPETLAAFREVRDTLRARGLQTLALPLLVSDEPYTWVSYNNVLMERRRDGRLHVYMPTYALPVLDRRATEIYEGMGAVVHPIAVEHLFRLGGTVRCLVAPLRRG